MTRILLFASQAVQQELGLIAQVLQSQGFVQQSAAERDPNVHALVFYTEDRANQVSIKLYQELGVMRLELTGALGLQIATALETYLEPLSSEKIEELYELSKSGMEQRIYAVLLVLTYVDASTAMGAMRQKYLIDGNDATREGMIQGIAFLETHDMGVALEEIEKHVAGSPVEKMARRAIDALSERGLLQESDEFLITSLESIIDSSPQVVMDKLSKMKEQPPALRFLHAKALRLLLRHDEAATLLAEIHPSDPDAAKAYAERAILREQGGYHREALDDAQRALACDPELVVAQEVYERLRLIEQQSGASDEERLLQLNAALASNSDDSKLLVRRAETLLALNKHEEALDDLRRVEKISPTDPRLPALLAEALLAAGILGEALAEATKAQSIFAPKYKLQAKLLKPRVFLALNRPHMALPLFREIFKENPSALVAAFGMALAHELQGENESAQQILKHLDPKRAESFIKSLKPRIYTELPLTKAFCKDCELPISPIPSTILDQEKQDPLFKRCDQCGALTLKRRTLCKECSGSSFF
ncbi:MAG: hypothetical protein WC966_03065 [Bradymonadales bacterium]|jgi:tetratricopeptide (TPR) repeat protein